MPRPQRPKLYWIDHSCDQATGGDFEAYILEARHWARRAAERLRSGSDTDFARVFNVVFKTPRTDRVPCSAPSFWQQVNGIQPEAEWKPSARHVLDVLRDFAHGWARTPDRRAADVRLYAGAAGLARWRRTRVGHGRSARSFYYDPVNHVRLTGDWDNLVAGQAFTSWMVRELGLDDDDNPLPPPPRRGQENPLRVTIDVCPGAWEPSAAGHGPASLARLSASSLLAGTHKVGRLAESLIPRLLFHEFMHCRHYLLDDHRRDRETSGWKYCMRRKKGEAATCAESMAMLGLWAGLADLRPRGQPRGGFTLDRKWDKIPGGWDDEEVFSDDEDAGAGEQVGCQVARGKQGG